MQGWIKLHRSVTDSFVFQNPDRLKFWIWCLCKASHKERKHSVGLKEVSIKEGQFVFGRKKASMELNMEESKVYRLIKTFEKREKIEVKSNNKFSVVTIANWSFYQDGEQQSEQQSNNKLTTNEQQSNTNKNVKNIENVKKEQKHTCVYEYWQLKAPHKHRELSDSIAKELNKLKSNDVDLVKESIDRYVKAYNDKDYFYNQKWVLNNFLKQGNGYKSWLDEGQNWVMYNERKTPAKNSYQKGGEIDDYYTT